MSCVDGHSNACVALSTRDRMQAFCGTVPPPCFADGGFSANYSILFSRAAHHQSRAGKRLAGAVSRFMSSCIVSPEHAAYHCVAGIYMISARIAASDTCTPMRAPDGRGYECQTVCNIPSRMVTRTRPLLSAADTTALDGSHQSWLRS